MPMFLVDLTGKRGVEKWQEVYPENVSHWRTIATEIGSLQNVLVLKF